MRILAIDTTGQGCLVALRAPGQPDAVHCETMARGQAERLAPLVENILETVSLSPRDIDRIGVCTGPGSFAGSRIGVAFARGLALAVGANCVGITRLAWDVASAGADGDRIAVHDARRGDVVLQPFSAGQATLEPATMSVEAARREFVRSWRPEQVLGSGAGLITGVADTIDIAAPDPGALLDLTASAIAPFDPPKPFYARPPDAKLPAGQ
ncbi:tRNA (adenosine(37)-N6)-threonylcarbamoyltransferase complex dimerization subunit type 1 TsaB [Hyphobacterium sp.]|uniref:tRNA (adenosine(37)-N6)-threonylcarbamoyltransferase complex dimerization subunit type 1 TsaB n=1 Tax=Hyphobacterium sp. TaxID=2004662 RepID=UPI003B525818